MTKIKQIVLLTLVLVLAVPQTSVALTLQEILQGYDNQQGQVLGAATPAFVQSSSCYLGSSSCTITLTNTFGNLLWVGINDYSMVADGYTFSVSDTQGNTYAAVSAATDTGNGNAPQKIQEFYAIGVSSGSNTITCNRGHAGGSGRCTVLEYSGIAATNPLDSHMAAANSNVASYTSGSLTTANTDDLLIGFLASRNAPLTWTNLSGTSRYSDNTDFGILIEDQNVSAAGNYAASATASTQGYGVASITAFKASGSTTTPPPAADTIAPSVPTNLSATAVSSSQINLSWIASTDTVGVTGYKIYRAGTQIANSLTNSYSNTGLSASTAYTYTVSAYDGANNNSLQSSSASATTQQVVTQSSVGADCVHFTCYYVDTENGLDTNDGLSKINSGGNNGPWKHAPKMAGATGIAAAHTVLQTDAIVFKGGVVNSLATGSLPWSAAWDNNRYGAAINPNPSTFRYPGNYIGYDPNWHKGQVFSVFITDPGVDCNSLTVRLVGGGGTGATAVGNLEPTYGHLKGFPRNVIVTNPGSGYTSNPTVDFSGSSCTQLPTAEADIFSPIFDMGGQLWNGVNGAGNGGPGTNPVAFYGWDYGTMDHIEWRNMQIDSINTTQNISMVAMMNCNYCTVQYNYFHNWFGSSHKLGANTSFDTALAYNFFYPLVLGGGGYANIGTAMLYNHVENSEAEILGEPTSDRPTTCGWDNNYPNPTTPSHLDTPCSQGGGVGGAQIVAYNIVHNARDGLRGGPVDQPLSLHDNHVWGINNDCCSQHADGIYLGNGGVIYNNKIHDIAGGSAAFYIQTTSGGNSPVGFGMEIFNNKCWNIGGSTPCLGWTSEFFGNSASAPNPPVVLNVYNNTFHGYYGTGVCANAGQWFGNSGSYVMKFNIYNNICISDQTGDPYITNPVPGGNSGNLYNGLTVTPSNLTIVNSQNVMLTTQQSLAQGYIQSYYDYIDSPYSPSPLTRRKIRSSTHFRPTSASAAGVTFNGVNLTNGTASLYGCNSTPPKSMLLSALCYDDAGNLRPITGSWQAGASQYTGSIITPPPPTSTKFTPNQRIQTNSNLNVRSAASATGTLLGTQPLGSLGTIISGGQSADGFFWWNVNYDSGVDGYSVENYLSAYTAPIVGDLNLDHIVNSLDFSLLNSKWNQNYSAYDLNGDGFINSFDYAVLKTNWGKTW